MESYLLLKFTLDRKFDDFIQSNIYNFENIGFEVDDPIEKQNLLLELPEWEISDIKVVDNGTISYGVYFEESDLGKSELERLRTFLTENIENFKSEELFIDNSNWEEEWKKSYKSFNIGNKIFIKPSWEERPETERIVIEIDPKMAFGTGTHETTSMCMEYVEDDDFTGKNILDMGCGSGILSILAKKLNANQVDACDIDEIAISSTNENSVINNVELNAFVSDLFSNVKNKYDFIFANILAEIIVVMLDDVDKYLNENGILILSGIIKEKEQLVKEKLEATGFKVIDTKYKNDWVLISAGRKNA
ncbi:50S ribosomal protein L11 methyltransferase [Helcococcus ovis]|uniref:50S ribosomal protein L11 methyltransferase n=1 Tax=Helcococcus ovis TaxID=72026 RepID=UPI0010702826|nr:50S ribosomal protein L11 methyltransferase [Helcococcus ovis]TFF66807.1 50S ribosomal protein L11 methyltransferase [Helcococcus ovis]WNZ01032.1 50S ribosomal protein L11 methyltransferase [Helcococcus ovis]